MYCILIAVEPCSGKTTLVRRLMTDQFSSDVGGMTDGVITYEWTHENIIFSLWDFGGQKVYYNTHTIFFNSYSVFLLVWNPREHDNFDTAELQGYIQVTCLNSFSPTICHLFSNFPSLNHFK